MSNDTTILSQLEELILLPNFNSFYGHTLI